MAGLAAWWRSLTRYNKAFAAFLVLDVVLLTAVAIQPRTPRREPVLNVVPAPTVRPTATARSTATPTVTAPTAAEPTAEPTATPEPKPTPKPTPVPTPIPIEYEALTAREWAQVVKAPDSYIGEHYELWSCITQFDAATGLDSFRAQASYRNETYWFPDGENALFTGDAGELAEFVTGDVLLMNVDVVGSLAYDTQVGGSTTAPLFRVVAVPQIKLGAC